MQDKKHKILYTADIHGNEIQYKILVNYAIKIKADTIIIGGDIAPKEAVRGNYIEGQREFFEKKLPKLLKPLKEKLSSSQIFLMMGNDDCAANLDMLKKNENKLYKIIHFKRIKITNDFDIVGYAYVPITPFKLKDWEKFDLTNTPSFLKEKYEERKNTNYNFEGVKSSLNGWKKFIFNNEIEKISSIQKDLEKNLFGKNARKTIYTIHSPPNKTKLDITSRGENVGSFAVRLFIEKYQPYLTLHGHIHETVDMSGSFKNYIGNSLCLTAGNHNIGNKLAVLVFDLHNPRDAERLIIR